jgi:transposase
MAKPLVDDELWSLVEPLLPKRPARARAGRPPADGRLCLTGILLVLKTGIAWEDFPREMGCCAA